MIEPQAQRSRKHNWTWVLILLAVALLAFAFDIDSRVDGYVDGTPLERFCAQKPVAMLMRLPGNWPLVAVTAVALGVIHPNGIRWGSLLAVADIVAGTLVAIMKGTFGRARPGTWPGTPQWVWFRGGWHGFWHQSNVGFASGDACQAFVWAEVLAIAVPRLRWPAYAWAFVTAGQRIVVGAHYLSDVITGAILGIVTVRLLLRILLAIAPPTREGPGVEM